MEVLPGHSSVALGDGHGGHGGGGVDLVVSEVFSNLNDSDWT